MSSEDTTNSATPGDSPNKAAPKKSGFMGGKFMTMLGQAVNSKLYWYGLLAMNSCTATLMFLPKEKPPEPGAKIFFDDRAGNLIVHSSQDLRQQAARGYYIEGNDTIVRFNTKDLMNGYEFSLAKQPSQKTPDDITDDRLVIDYADENISDVTQSYPLPSPEELAAIDPKLPVLVMLSSSFYNEQPYSDALARKIYGAQQVVHLQDFNVSQFQALGDQLKSCKHLADAEYHFAFIPAHHGPTIYNPQRASDYASFFKDNDFRTPDNKMIPAQHQFDMDDRRLTNIIEDDFPGEYTRHRMLFTGCKNNLENFTTYEGKQPALLLTPSPANSFGFGSTNPTIAEKAVAEAAGLNMDDYTAQGFIRNGLSALLCLRNFEGLQRTNEVMDRFSDVPVGNLLHKEKNDVHDGWRICVNNELATKNAKPLVTLPAAPAPQIPTGKLIQTPKI